MSVHIHLAVKRALSPRLLSKLRRFLQTVIQTLSCSKEFHIILIGDRRARHLNQTYLGHSYPADVLTFPLDETVEVYVNVDELARQKNISELLGFYALHGVLHGCGHTHRGEEDTRKMKTLEQRWMEQWKALVAR